MRLPYVRGASIFPRPTESVMGKSMDKDVVYAWAGFPNGWSRSWELVGKEPKQEEV